MRSTLLAFLILSCSGFAAMAATAAEQSCKMRAAMVAGATSKPTGVGAELFAWNKTMAPATIAGALAVLDTLDYLDSSVFQAIKVGQYHHVHLITAGLGNNSPLYIEMRYQRVGKDMRLTNIQFKDKLGELFPSLTPGTVFEEIGC